MEGKAYSQEEDALIIRTWSKLDIKGMAKSLTRSISSVTGRRKRLIGAGLVSKTTKKTAREWSEREIQILSDCYGLEAIKVLSRRLGRTPESIRVKTSKLGIGFTGQFYSMATLALELGVSRYFIKQRIERKWIQARQADFPFRYGRCTYIILEDSIVDYLKKHPLDLSGKQISNRYFWNVVQEAKLGIEGDTSYARN